MNSKIISLLAVFSLVFLPLAGVLNAQEGTTEAPPVVEEAQSAAEAEAVVDPLSATISSPEDGATVMLGESFTFAASATGGEAPYAYVWSFGDGTTGAGASVGSKVYEEAGSFDVSLEVTDFSGETATDEITVTVEAEEEEADELVATITTPSNNAEFEVDEDIAFAASATGGEAPYAYVWSFGDGTTGAGASVSKSYAATGTYAVTVEVTDFAGTETTDTVNVVVGDDDNGNGGEEEDLTISNIEVTDVTHDSATITWTTNRPASSRVIYDTESHSSIDGESAPNFGYANSTGTTNTNPKVTEHSVTISGLAAETSYYFRVISQE